MHALAHGGQMALMMAWEIFWALAFGFGVSAALQICVSRERMLALLGRPGLKEIALAVAAGAASSSCSYAAAAAAKTAFRKGAAFVPAMAFMLASTNLVVELGTVLWLLLGGAFVAAEVLGAFFLVGFLWLLARFTLPEAWVAEARRHGNDGGQEGHPHGHEHGSPDSEEGAAARIADAFFIDVGMMWKEILIGLLIAGFFAALVPPAWWQALFLAHGPAPLRLIENCVAGPLIAIASFVCSVGNIPLAATLWAGGIGFGGVISFIYADLLILPLLLVYRKAYGGRLALYILGAFFVSTVLSGIAVDLIFTALRWVPEAPAHPPEMTESFRWNYTAWLNLAAAAGIGALAWLRFGGKRRRPARASCCH